MGNISSSNSKNEEKEFKNFYDVIDYIATYYILTMDFKSLSKLSEKAYCDKLVVLTSDIINRHFNDMEVTFLAQRIKNGVEVNDLTKENISFINKDKLEELDISNDANKSIKKKRVCIGIAKFYVKIAHVFAAIVMTINPVYTYKDNTGQIVKTGLLEKDKIPKNSNRKLYKLNICDNRIRALKRGEFFDDDTGNVTIQPQVCNMNVNKDGTVKDLKDEPGIPELMNLYLDDNYDYSNGTFTGMTDKTRVQFMKDLKAFYVAFTENENMPPEITKFSDIKLRDYRNKPGCQGATPIFKSKITLNKKDKLFVEYAENIKKMIKSAADNQYKLLSVINDLFIFVTDPYSGKKTIRVNPKLTDELLQNCVMKSRRLIIDLYVKCETDYVNGMKIYEAIVESKILDTTQKQIDSLKMQAKKIIENTKKTVVPVKPMTPVSSGILPVKQVETVEQQKQIVNPVVPTTNSSIIVPIKKVKTIQVTPMNEPVSTSAIPSTTNAIPSTNVIPSTTNAIPSTTNVIPSTTTVIPSTTTEIPATTNAIPSTTNAIPSTTEIPSTSATLPPQPNV